MSNDPTNDNKTATISPATAAIIEKGHKMNSAVNPALSLNEDKRETARHEHTNHFTNRATPKDQ